MMDTEGKSKAFRFEANAFDLIRYWAAVSYTHLTLPTN